MQQANISHRNQYYAQFAPVLLFSKTPQTRPGGDLDLQALHARSGPMKVSAVALEQYLNAANPICSG